MFPQSELDNYKLQVELLQEKLQRSEISRQQLEHKLDKILQKRDEHDKTVRSKSKQKYQQFLEEQHRRNERNKQLVQMLERIEQQTDKTVRSKSKQKYQQFLEEQHRRNERNKQLVQMLERIEQQTSAMNARSERLKMMKLQYEMYFAKLVHTQTRRCIQNSTVNMTTTPMMGTTLPRPVGQTMMVPTSSVEGFNYSNVYNEPSLLGNDYHRFLEHGVASDHFVQRQQNQPTASAKIMEMSTPDFRTNFERNEYFDMKKHDPYQKPKSYDTTRSSTDFVENPPQFRDSVSITKDKEYYSNKPEKYVHQQLPHSADFATEIKAIHDMDIPTTPSSLSTVPTFNRLSNIDNEVTLNPSDGNKDCPKNNLQMANEISKTPGMSIDNSNTEGTSSEISTNFNMDTAQIDQTPVPQPAIEPHIEPLLSANQQLDSTSHQIPVEDVTYSKELHRDENDPIHSSPAKTLNLVQPIKAPVSLENIENAIYGELVNPPEETPQLQNKPNVAPELLENLVTLSPETIETDDVPKKEEQHVNAEENVENYENDCSKGETPTTAINTNYEQNLDYSGTGVNLSTNDVSNDAQDYTTYENSNITAGDEGQQEQQYDYTNYDPSQYSYPGYIYDESTGEYKPDPNAPAEQYATDQQYAQGYDQQYQQEGYDYNQAYDQQNPQSGPVESAYENYDAMQQSEQSATSNNAAEESLTSPQELQSLTQEPRLEPATQDSETPVPLAADVSDVSTKHNKPTSILSTAEKNDQQKKKKRVNFVDSSETDDSSLKAETQGASKIATGNESDFDFSSGSEAGAKNV